jgi:outer membrane receptor for ferrienterochelin and colicin
MPTTSALKTPLSAQYRPRRKTLSALIPLLPLLSAAPWPAHAQQDTVLDEVLVTATYLQRRAQDIAGTVSVITD